MQGGRGRGRGRGGGGGSGNPFFGFGSPFAGFGGMPSLFGGRDPFDDPFFTQPFGGIFPTGLGGSPFMDLNPFGSSLFGPRASPFINEQVPRIHETRPSLPNSSRGPIIEELNSDDENEQLDDKKEDYQTHGRSQIQPYIEHPDDEVEGEQRRGTEFGNDASLMNHTRMRPQTHSFSFQSSTVTYGGSNGAYHTSSTTKRSGSDGLRFEEYKEADTVTGQAAHRVSRGIHDKGHTVTRNLKSDGQVDTMQVLHNIDEDEVNGFEEAWKGKARKHLPGSIGGPSINEGLGEASRRGGWALPSTESTRGHELENPASASRSHAGVKRKPDVAEHAESAKVRRC